MLSSRHFGWVFAVILGAVAAVCGAGGGAAAEALFDGATLEGWSGNPELWRVENGEIVGSTEGNRIAHNTFLVYEKPFSDFVLTLRVKLRNGNSGVQFRSEAHPDHVVKGYQADVAEQTYFGMLYEEGKRGFMPYWNELSKAERDAVFAAARPGEWNHYEITCEGDRIKLVLNGTTTCDIRDPAGAKTGVIALQLHTGPAMEVRFKDIEIRDLAANQTAQRQPAGALMPDYDQFRTEKLEVLGGQFRVPEGFSVEHVATNDLTGSVINMTFDAEGRPLVASEREGVWILLDTDGDGVFDEKQAFSGEVGTAMGLHFLAPGDLLVQADGPDGPGMYRLTDTDGDDAADRVRRIMLSNGGMGEHGPHAILTGPDGYLYVLYGNHAYPREGVAPDSPSRDLEEDHLLPRYVDPRGHANSIRAPAGTIHRVSPDLETWQQIAAGFRNPYDFAANALGELFAFDADMEWDRGLPWYRPIRIAHTIPAGDYGWRTGSSKMPFYYIDTLPSVDDIGRGSPVGIAFYYHRVYPQQFHGALFTGDWTRGRIRVLFPRQAGATYAGKSVDFLLGEPLNVTDLDVGPDGFLYFTVGGRGTTGGMYRVRYDSSQRPTVAVRTLPEDIAAVVRQPMPRSAWGKAALLEQQRTMGGRWGETLRDFVLNANPRATSEQRIRALEALQVYGPKPGLEFLRLVQYSNDERLVAAATMLLGTFPYNEVKLDLAQLLDHYSPMVRRRAAEALVRSGLNVGRRVRAGDDVVKGLLGLLDDDDRFVRYAARHALMRVDPNAWANEIVAADARRSTRATLEGLTALIRTMRTATEADAIFAKLDSLVGTEMSVDDALAFQRVLQLAFIRDVIGEERTAFREKLGSAVMDAFPAADPRLNREQRIMLAYLKPDGAIDALLGELAKGETQEDQIHTAYCLRAIESGWNKGQRDRFVAWFDTARQMRGAASMEGYINALFTSTLDLLPQDERLAAEARKEQYLKERQERVLALMAEVEGEEKRARDDLAQMSFDELAEYLEYDPMAYRQPNPERGMKVFYRARCVECHVYGDIGRGGGPDLSTLASRFRRRDILEAIMYPSKVISDQYTALDVETRDGNWTTGMLAGETRDDLTLITPQGERVTIVKENIDTRQESELSVMPEGLLDMMSLSDLINLVQFLEAGNGLEAD